jgi:hypothetical protein
MRQLSDSGITPGRTVTVTRAAGGWEITGGLKATVLSPAAADGIFVSVATSSARSS